MILETWGLGLQFIYFPSTQTDPIFRFSMSTNSDHGIELSSSSQMHNYNDEKEKREKKKKT